MLFSLSYSHLLNVLAHDLLSEEASLSSPSSSYPESLFLEKPPLVSSPLLPTPFLLLASHLFQSNDISQLAGCHLLPSQNGQFPHFSVV